MERFSQSYVFWVSNCPARTTREGVCEVSQLVLSASQSRILNFINITLKDKIYLIKNIYLTREYLWIPLRRVGQADVRLFAA